MTCTFYKPTLSTLYHSVTRFIKYLPTFKDACWHIIYQSCMWLPVNTPKLARIDDSNRKVGSDVTPPLLSTPCVDKAQWRLREGKGIWDFLHGSKMWGYDTRMLRSLDGALGFRHDGTRNKKRYVTKAIWQPNTYIPDVLMHLLASLRHFLHIEQIRSKFTYQASCSENLYRILTIKTHIPQCALFLLDIVQGLLRP
jgi:hypothetical protein